MNATVNVNVVLTPTFTSELMYIRCMDVSVVSEGATVAVVTSVYVCNTHSRVFDLLRLCN